MIPKIIHYCWFGNGPMPELEKKCIASWKKYCPDYELMEWNESNFDIELNAYVKGAYENKKWAFVADVARLYALVTYGGIYMDTDVELVKPLDEFLLDKAFVGFGGMGSVETGIIAGEAHFEPYEELLREYDNRLIVKEDGSLDLTANTHPTTDICIRNGLVLNNTKQTVGGITVYPADYFSPKNWYTRAVNITPNTAAIHHFDGLWLSEETRYRQKLCGQLCHVLPYQPANAVAKLATVIKHRGLGGAIQSSVARIRRGR